VVLPKEEGNPSIKSMDISDHTCSWMGRGYSKPEGLVFAAL